MSNGAIVNPRSPPVNIILMNRQPILTLGDLPGNERDGDVFFKLSLSA